ncbi:MAG: hypothetical protein A3I00_09855 [Betaproteobacteria bacterium RIFCSPLOWO2_02_FULL_64_12]|nr:MAG: hypothetical protein A3I00_09855 [Betaproteobacteria bacterium RIFCSPLOWO2_02_FULL_64_12]
MKASARISLLTMLNMVVWACGVPLGHAAPTIALSPDSRVDLRSAYATTQELAEGKQLAEASCARCHGLNGISTTEGVPHIAGQRPAYLHFEMRVYQSGGRDNKPMTDAVKFLSDDALMKVAAYYGSLDPAPVTAAGPRRKAAPDRPDPIATGKAAAAGCAGCHGETGVSKIPGMPSVVGFDPKYFIAAISAYKRGERKHDMMKTLVSALKDADVKNMALFYALQKPDRAKTPAPGNKEAGKKAAASCSGCHGEGGVSTSPATPSIAGQDGQYFVAAMRAYKNGSRTNQSMKGPASATDDNILADLAAYYASQQPKAPKVAKPLSIAEWAQRCDRCHGINGNSTDLRTPALAGQRVDYLIRVLRAYQKGGRKSKEMNFMTDVLTDADVEGLGEHYARQTARSVVYVLVPPR